MIQNTSEFKKLNKQFEDLLYRHDAISVFDDLLTVTICALSMGQMEDEYMQVISRYKKNEQQMLANMFANLLACYIAGSDESGAWCDPLGHLFEEHNGKFGRDARGQFFTPETVCNFMAQIIEPSPSSRVNDPACGSGRTLLAADRINPNNRIKNTYVAMDLDFRCVKMCTINFIMHGMSGVVIHMNTLSMEVYSGFRVYLPETGLGVRKLSKPECFEWLVEQSQNTDSEELKPEPQQEPPRNNANITQISLF